MRRWMAGFVSTATATAVAVGLGALSPLPSPAAAAAPASVSALPSVADRATVPIAAKKRKPGNKARNYNPKPGLRFNEPYGRGGQSARKIRRHVLKTIDSTRQGDVVQIAAWNVRGASWTNALIRAHKRGAAVQVIIDTTNWAKDHPNPEVARFAKVVRGKEKRAEQSFLKQCVRSCRGGGGIPHSKFFLFSRAASSQFITMFGSNNATDVAAKDQWNDLYTYVGDQGIYQTFRQIFVEMAADQNQGQNGFRRLPLNATDKIDFYPYKGAITGQVRDPDMARLNAIQCTGATGTAGRNGRTTVRIIQTAIHGERGIELARKLVALHQAGCSIRVVYAIMGGKVHQILKRAGVPKLQLAYDRDRNGVYDIYVHLKSLAISGVYAGRTDANVTVNGSANWSRVPLRSDEVVAEYHDAAMTKTYTKWTNFLFKNRPKSWGRVNLAPMKAAGSGVKGRAVQGPSVNGRQAWAPVARDQGPDPYALMRAEGIQAPKHW